MRRKEPGTKAGAESRSILLAAARHLTSHLRCCLCCPSREGPAGASVKGRRRVSSAAPSMVGGASRGPQRRALASLDLDDGGVNRVSGNGHRYVTSDTASAGERELAGGVGQLERGWRGRAGALRPAWASELLPDWRLEQAGDGGGDGDGRR
uniref:Uncharacterized protein n=1 Tax=Setaria viridis TaxID=4556 RepID=A0A4U6U032_SETVI|nr:hypothetical protein SEVIR_7G299400v2 [Setaria viridis]